MVVATNIVLVPVLTLVGSRFYQRTMLFWSVAGSIVLLAGLWLALAEAATGNAVVLDQGSGSGSDGSGKRVYSEGYRTTVMVGFVLVEILMAFDIDQFWCYIEESCNLQQAKTLFNVVNYVSAPLRTLFRPRSR